MGSRLTGVNNQKRTRYTTTSSAKTCPSTGTPTQSATSWLQRSTCSPTAAGKPATTAVQFTTCATKFTYRTTWAVTHSTSKVQRTSTRQKAQTKPVTHCKVVEVTLTPRPQSITNSIGELILKSRIITQIQILAMLSHISLKQRVL